MSITHSTAHYLMAINYLKDKKGYARVTDIAKELGLTKGSVSTAMNQLKKQQLIQEEEDTKFLELTSDGKKQVQQVLASRQLLFHLFNDLLELNEQDAMDQACLMEHLVDKKNQTALFNFLRLMFSSEQQKEFEQLRKRLISKLDNLSFDQYIQSQAQKIRGEQE